MLGITRLIFGEHTCSEFLPLLAVVTVCKEIVIFAICALRKNGKANSQHIIDLVLPRKAQTVALKAVILQRGILRQSVVSRETACLHLGQRKRCLETVVPKLKRILGRCCIETPDLSRKPLRESVFGRAFGRDVDHACNGRTPEQCGLRSAQYFDPTNVSSRQMAEVEADRDTGRVIDADTINKNGNITRIRPAQTQRGLLAQSTFSRNGNARKTAKEG